MVKKICVIGLGYIGLPTSIIFAKHGFQVHGMDVNADVVRNLNHKQLHIEEPGLQEALTEVVDSGHLTFATAPVEADVFIIAVPSPITDNKTANLDYVKAATESIVPYVQAGNLVVLESTVPPRTVEDVMLPVLEETGLSIGSELYVAHSPERVIPGKIFKELEANDRIVGGVNEESGKRTKAIYQTFVQGNIHLTDATTAEMAKVMENTYRDVNIAFANELAKLSEEIGINVWEAIRLANYHPRVNIHQPGPGVGGHCIAVDPWFLAEQQPDIARMIALARRTNDDMPVYTADKIWHILHETYKLAQPKVALLGLSFKGNVDDMRESPSLKIMEHLNQIHMDYTVYDPHMQDIRVPHQVTDLDEAIADAAIVVILTDHDEFKAYNPAEIARAMQHKIVLDTKNCLPEAEWRAAGFDFIRLGDTKNR
ncbi:nucleotide sugar dehydrogenase [Lentibacillus cibarius]|uniref:Nucleotide sugar dehydrogenase n=1 Tax=Lentibacillus cibarius TaxID=2583219 RepID=A0A5S3QJP0_9BACI|nr:nucleotide sugar dehydrogenase [Lentibacillus cibarius]TMN21949.1 nucleotide sugar dehydrogenase [Lentibacillus cibarius]